MLNIDFFLPISKYLTGCRSANSMSPIVGIQIETLIIFVSLAHISLCILFVLFICLAIISHLSHILFISLSIFCGFLWLKE